MTLRVCNTPGCPALTPRPKCDDCSRDTHRRRQRDHGTRTDRGLGSDWERLRTRLVRTHTRTHGYICPGWNRPPHAADPNTNPLTGDHIVERHIAPERALDPDNIQILCRACNTSKSHTIRNADDPDTGPQGGHH